MKRAFITISILCSILVAASVWADTILLSNGNLALFPYPSPYAEVTINLIDSDTAEITVAGKTPTGYVYLIGDGGSVGLNTNGAVNLILSSIAWVGGNGVTAFSNGGEGNEDGFGKFNFTLNNFDGFTSAVNSITFRIDKKTGTWTNAADVLVANKGGNSAAAHIFVWNGTSTDALATGFAANGIQVPEPTTLLLLGAGLVGLAIGGRRLRKR